MRHYHIPSENVPLKSEIFTKNIKEWPIEILYVHRKCPIFLNFNPNHWYKFDRIYNIVKMCYCCFYRLATTCFYMWILRLLFI
jgi:hypothetical protein